MLHNGCTYLSSPRARVSEGVCVCVCVYMCFCAYNYYPSPPTPHVGWEHCHCYNVNNAAVKWRPFTWHIKHVFIIVQVLSADEKELCFKWNPTSFLQNLLSMLMQRERVEFQWGRDEIISKCKLAILLELIWKLPRCMCVYCTPWYVSTASWCNNGIYNVL